MTDPKEIAHKLMGISRSCRVCVHWTLTNVRMDDRPDVGYCRTLQIKTETPEAKNCGSYEPNEAFIQKMLTKWRARKKSGR